MRIDIKPCNTKGQEITKFIEYFIELNEETYICKASYWCKEWEIDGNDIDNMIRASSQKPVYRDYQTKIKKTAILRIEKYYDKLNEAWCIQLDGHVTDDIHLSTEKDAEELYDLLDKWLFQ